MSILSVEQALQQAINHHQAGQLPEAEHLYRAILRTVPQHADANHNLGILALNVNNPNAALPFLKQALESNPSQVQFWLSYIEGLLQAEQLDLARAVLAQAQGFGLDGEPAAQLSQRLATPTRVELESLATLFNQHHYAEAENLARDLIARFPQQGLAWKALGAVLQNQGNFAESLTANQQAIALLPHDAEAFYNAANLYKELGQLAEAERHYRQAIALNPNDADSYNNLALVLHELHRFDEAEACYQQAIAINPHHAQAYLNLSTTQKQLGRLTQAKNSCLQAIAAQPEYAEAYNNLGIILAEQGDLMASEDSYRQAITLNPDYADAHNNLGITLKSTGHFKQAERCHRHAIALQPHHVHAYNNLALTLKELGRFTEAEKHYRQALTIDPTYTDAYNNLGVTLQAAQRLQEAETCYRQALRLQPEAVEANLNLGNVLKDQGRFAEAEQCYLTTLKIKPTLTTAAANLLYVHNYTLSHSAQARLAEAQRYGELARQKVTRQWTTWDCKAQPKCLRVGLVSGDLREHVVSHFLDNFLAHLDKSQIELIAYSNYAKMDAVSERLKGYFADWKMIFALNDADAAQLIHADGVHILIDLAGHTAHNRLLLFAWKPAPIQISWLGYWATTGLAEMDYVLVDKIGVPEQNQHHFVEKIHYLPTTRLCFSVPTLKLAVSALPALENGFITFGCFQNLSKVTDAVLAVWGEIFAKLPTARLRLQSKQLRDPAMLKILQARLAHCGIDSERTRFYPSGTREAYLRAHSEVDFILDTFPYTGGTTTCEALWMGVPTLTLAGETLLARQGASLLAAAGLSEWIAETEQRYIEQALAFANDLPYLACLRQRLRSQVLASPLFDGEQFAQNFENTLWELWLDYQSVTLPLGCGKNEIR